MATIDQIKSLMKAALEDDKERLKTVALQIAAYESKQGHTTSAREIKDLVDKAISKSKIVHINNSNQMLQVVIPDEKLKDLIVSEEILVRIERILMEFKNQKKLNQYGLCNRRKILLEGKPGTGKTMTASVLASELSLPLFIVQMDKLVTKFMGETSAKLRQIFDSIENNIGVYLFDEFDAIGADRSLDNEVGEMRRVLNSFLQFIEQDNSRSIIIAATNNQHKLDKALFRRFDDVLHYSYPSKEEIYKLFKAKLKMFASSYIPQKELIEAAISLSQAEIARVCDDAIKNAILNDKKIQKEDLIRLVNERKSVYYKEVK